MSGFKLIFGVVLGACWIFILGVVLVRGTRAGKFVGYDSLDADRVTRPIRFRVVQFQLMASIAVLPTLAIMLVSGSRMGELLSYPFLASFGLWMFLSGGIMAHAVAIGFKLGECVANRYARLELKTKRRMHPIAFWTLQLFIGAVSLAFTAIGFGVLVILARSALIGDLF